MSDSPNHLADLRVALEKARESAEYLIDLGDQAPTLASLDDVFAAVSTALAAAEAEREGMREALSQAGCELQEAANCLRPYLPRLAGVIDKAANAATHRALNSEPSDAP